MYKFTCRGDTSEGGRAKRKAVSDSLEGVSRAPAIGGGFPPGYKSCIAQYPGDPNAFCRTKVESEDKLKRQGQKILKD